MANKDPKGRTKYFYDGTSGLLIRSKEKTPIKSQAYWYNGQPQGYIAGFIEPAIAKKYIILIGF
jgi:hypothetical protein